jgi:hypothetical protein
VLVSRPPPSLAELKAGEIAVSDPVLLDLQADAVNLDQPTEALLDQMLNTVNVDRRHRRIGVYWETYGISATDTITVSVRVATDEQLSAMRRLGMRLNLAENPNREVVQSWTLPDPQRGSSIVAGRVPIGINAIVLNLSQLQPDSYVLEVSIERAGVVATGRRRITVNR